ncbi:MAG: hypothetical protein HZA04_02945 [Nitrospinae bacterium]|nr:hypothetical protein [Nitrospinota bacterium]
MTMSAKAIRVYNILKARNFSDEEAQEVVDFMDTAPKEGLVSKEDIANLKVELIKWMIGVGIAGFTAQVALLKILKVI